MFKTSSAGAFQRYSNSFTFPLIASSQAMSYFYKALLATKEAGFNRDQRGTINFSKFALSGMVSPIRGFWEGSILYV